MEASSSPSTSGAAHVQAQLLLPVPHDRRIQLDPPTAAPMCHVLQLDAGSALLTHDKGELPAHAPDVMWVPAGSAHALELQAGSAGVWVAVSGSLLDASLVKQLSSEPLRQLSQHLGLFNAQEPQLRQELSHSLLAIEAESRADFGASWHYLVAHLSIVLIMLWRMAGRETGGPAPLHGRADPRLQRFRQLVEARFREHWTMVRYAAELAISADRLHDLCVRELRRTPITLVHQRLVQEACTELTHSDQAIEQLASQLGFANASHFSRFFKRWMQLSPKAYRQKAHLQSASGRAAQKIGFADWP